MLHLILDGKPGMCPAEAEAMRYMGGAPTTTAAPATRSNEPGNGDAPPINAEVEKSGVPEHDRLSAQSASTMSRAQSRVSTRQYAQHHPYPPKSHHPCVSDYHCPGDMKCCSQDIRAYGDGSIVARHDQPTKGFCLPPVMPAAASTPM